MAILEMKQNFNGSCLICNCMPVDETSELRKPHPMIHAAGVDVNWGQDLNICVVCAGVMADMLGRPDELKVKALSNKWEALKTKYDELNEKHEKMESRMKRMIDGKRALKEHREESA